MDATPDPRRLSGRELLAIMMAGGLPAPTIGATMGLVLSEIGEGYARFEATPDARHLNPMGGVHGGFAATALDSATGCALHTTLGPGESYGTVHLEVKMLRAVPVGRTLIAEARVLRAARTVGFSEGVLKDAEGTVYAHGSATLAINRAA